MTRNRGNAIVKFIMIVAVAAVIFLALDFWLGTQQEADEVASGPAPVAEETSSGDSSGGTAEDAAASQAASAARAAVASGMTLEEAREIGRQIGSEIGTELGRSVGEETARSLIDEQVSEEGELVAGTSAPAKEPPPATAPEPEPSVQEEIAEEGAPEPPPAAEPEPVAEPEPEPEPAEVAEAAPPPPPPPPPKPKPKPSQYWWTSSFVTGGIGVGFVGPFEDSGVAILFTAPVEAGSLADNLKLTRGGSAMAAEWQVSDKNPKLVYASGLEKGSYQLRIGSVQSTDGLSVKRASSGSVTVK